ncbi:MAG TPA: hypothetical protein PLU91_09555 [Verrucomicrobiota bacterium]|nr:hypothetical protein [Verrucomicrobiota bacterium]
MGGLPGADGEVNAAVVDGSGNLYIGGSFTVVGEVLANYVAKWSGSAWSALGLGVNNRVHALAVSGTNLYVGGVFTMAGGKASAHLARAIIGETTPVAPVFTSIVPNTPGTQVLLTYTADPGASFYLLSSTNLTAWQTNTTVTATNVTNSVPVNMTQPREFFRLRRQR